MEAEVLSRHLNSLADEELVEMVQAEHSQQARDVLVQRDGRWVDGLVHNLARRIGLSEADAEDAVQAAMLNLLDAITDYGRNEAASDRCCFRSFAEGVIRRRFPNFVRSLYRQERDRERAMTPAAAEAAGRLRWRRVHPDEGSLHSEPADPSVAVVWREDRERLERALAQLDDTERQLYLQLATDSRLTAAAKVLGLSHKQTRRLWARVLAKMQSFLGIELD